jgi:hypothetical protein
MTSSVDLHKLRLSGTGVENVVNPASILDSIKKVLGFDASYKAFDVDIVMHINSAFGELAQLGVGAETGFVITDNKTLWSQYIAQLAYLPMVQQFIYMSVRLAFDPPERFALVALEKQIEKLASRINIAAEHFNPPSDPMVSGVGTFLTEVTPLLFKVKVVNLAFELIVTPDASVGNTFYLTMTGDCIINAPVSGVDGEHITLELISNGHAVTWGHGWNFGAAGLPILSPGGTTDIVSGVWKQVDVEWHAGFTAGF